MPRYLHLLAPSPECLSNLSIPIKKRLFKILKILRLIQAFCLSSAAGILTGTSNATDFDQQHKVQPRCGGLMLLELHSVYPYDYALEIAGLIGLSPSHNQTLWKSQQFQLIQRWSLKNIHSEPDALIRYLCLPFRDCQNCSPSRANLTLSACDIT